MPCSSCGKAAQQGMAVTSGDLTGEDRFVVTTPDGERRSFPAYADARQYQKQTGGILRTT